MIDGVPYNKLHIVYINATKNNTLIFQFATNLNGNQSHTTYGVLTGTTNTVTFSILCSVISVTPAPVVNFSNFYLRYTRIA
jgi:hypothetical protein